ncbi:MAG: hypothetical protein DI551_02965 [Micavibrio aeruginosavorus]|uniref:Uncharacterized protein n=1 Tax=Micavibrio aeruginosavorus TaxID=349221 RepID=A0A2W5N4V4_9BACT|nr:MAG: hypothetical protein DI551_02965 [Micavibrio aeruginosavorus]
MSTSLDFRENQAQMGIQPMLTIQPQGPEADVANNAQLSTAHRNTFNNNSGLNGMTAAAGLGGPKQQESQPGGQELTDKAYSAMSTTHQFDKVHIDPNENDAAFAMRQMNQTVGEAVTAFSSIFSLGDRNSDGVPDAEQQGPKPEEPKFAARPAVAPGMSFSYSGGA